MRDLLARAGAAAGRLAGRAMPDPFVLAVLLTLVVGGAALALTDTTLPALLDLWGGDAGVWGLLRFGMQMCLILVTGHAVADSAPARRLLARVAEAPRSARGAVLLVSALAMALGLVHWGVGLVGGALLARAVGTACERRGIAVHYPLLAAAGFLGMMVWHGGLSGSAPLKVTTEADLRELFGGTPPVAPIGLDRTLLGPLNLAVSLGQLVLVPFVMAAMAPRGTAARPASAFGVREGPAPAGPTGEARGGVVAWLDGSPAASLLLVLLIAGWAWRFVAPASGPSGLLRLTPDALNLLMLAAGLLLHRTPRAYVRAVERAATACAGIILQFPLYAGIMGMMNGSGLSARLATAVGDAAGPVSLPLLTFAAAAVLNLFVPSGGGQWAIQGPVALRAAAQAGVAPERLVMAVAYGDQLTNMLQPFWALPLLAVTGLPIREIVGYTAIAMLAGGAWIALAFTVL